MLARFFGLIVCCAFLVAASVSPNHGETVASRRLATLQRGINVTNWFRYPASANPAALRAYLSEQTLGDFRRAGFTFVRLSVMPDFLQEPDGTLHDGQVSALIDVIKRIEEANLAVVLVPHHDHWDLEHRPGDRQALVAFWTALAPRLSAVDINTTFPELLNEPVFPDAAEWNTLQAKLVGIIRHALPGNTLVLSPTRWSSVDNLPLLAPAPDSNVVYTVHFYEPALLAKQGTWDGPLSNADAQAIADLPFPSTNSDACQHAKLEAETPKIQKWIASYCGDAWTLERIKDMLGQAAEWGRQNHHFVFVGEFGILATHQPVARLPFLRAVHTASEANGLGWALWGYEDQYGFSVRQPAHTGPANMDPQILNALGLKPE